MQNKLCDEMEQFFENELSVAPILVEGASDGKFVFPEGVTPVDKKVRKSGGKKE